METMKSSLRRHSQSIRRAGSPSRGGQSPTRGGGGGGSSLPSQTNKTSHDTAMSVEPV